MFEILTWVTILVVANLVLHKILKEGWRSLFQPLGRILPRRSTKNDLSVWEHLDKDSN